MTQEPSDQKRKRSQGQETTSAEVSPDVGCQSGAPRRQYLLMKIARGLGWTACSLLVLISLLAAALYTVGQSVGNERLRLYAERTIGDLVGFDVNVALGGLRLGLGSSSLFAFEIRDVTITRTDSDDLLADAGHLRFGLKAIPLLSGNIELTRLTVADAAFPAGLPLPARQEVLTPKTVSHAVFGLARRAFAVTNRLQAVELSDVAFALDGERPQLTIARMGIRRHDGGRVSAEGVATHGGRRILLDGVAQQNGEVIEDLSIDLSSPAAERGAERASSVVRALGAVDISITGHEGEAASETTLIVETKLGETLLGFDKNELTVDSFSARVAFRETAEAFSVVASPVAVGRSLLHLQGTITPERDETPAYRFDLVSRDSAIAPAGSSESRLPFALRLSGDYSPRMRRLNAEEISLRTSGGDVGASAAITMPPNESAGITLAVYVDDLPTAHAKQFWPWFAAKGARNWSLRHVFGGRVYDSSLQMSVPPGRLGNGIPLSREELGGRFNLANTRFDIAGDMPPVRDGNGWVAFRGTDAKIGLTSGTIYMPSNREVDVSTGSLTITKAHLKPRIGQLEIDVAGDAAAMAELASYRPINASRFHDFVPEELSGATSGHLRAEIPLQDGIPVAGLDWRVNLEYEDLTIAEPVEGQQISSADGSLLIQPDRAEFAASALLNETPAKVNLVRPLGGSNVKPVRDVKLQVDDTTREQLVPGLGQFVSGPFSIDYQEAPDGLEKLKIALDDARLTIPGIGWEKPPGVPATATFSMKRNGDTVAISDFTLTGEDRLFIGGSMQFSQGRLQTARLDRVRLSDSDEFSARIRSDGENGYSIAVNGTSFDARSIIKDVLEDSAESRGSAPQNDLIRVDAQFDRVIGYNDQTIGQVEFQGSFGTGADQFSLSAATPSHGSFNVQKTLEQGRTIVRTSSGNAGAVLGFLDIYDHVEGGRFSATLSGAGSGLSGNLELRDFYVVNEPQLDFLVDSTRQENRRAKEVDTSRVFFDTGSAEIFVSDGGVQISNGVLRGPLMGSTFQGLLQDAKGNIQMTGTFMPAYGLNRIFGEIPIIGPILGNGRDQGLIGITYRLTGKFSDPDLDVNPISAIAPGIFRQIFEYR